jgi:glycosyltransferase involved in cell wall biosynthesis
MPNFVGGTTRLVYMVSAGLTDYQTDVHIFSTNQSSFNGPQDNTLIVDQKVKIHFVPYVYAFGRPITFDLFFRLIRFRPSLIHLYTPFPGAELACVAASKVLHVPMIVTWTMDALLERVGGSQGLGNLATGFYNFLSVFLLRSSDAVISLNKTYAERSQYLSVLRRKVPRFFFLHQGTDTERFKPLNSELVADFKRSRGLSGFFNILFVGRLVEYKGVDDLLEAFKILKKTCRNIKLLIVGDGSKRESLLDKTRKLGLQDDVIFFGYVPDDQLLYYYNASDIVVVPSKNSLENVPLSLLDSMACAKPVIHSDVGGARDQIQNGKVGLLVPAGDVEHLAKALEFMISNPGRIKEMGLAARQYAETVDWKKLSCRLQEMYQSTLVAKSKGKNKTNAEQTSTQP